MGEIEELLVSCSSVKGASFTSLLVMVFMYFFSSDIGLDFFALLFA